MSRLSRFVAPVDPTSKRQVAGSSPAGVASLIEWSFIFNMLAFILANLSFGFASFLFSPCFWRGLPSRRRQAVFGLRPKPAGMAVGINPRRALRKFRAACGAAIFLASMASTCCRCRSLKLRWP